MVATSRGRLEVYETEDFIPFAQLEIPHSEPPQNSYTGNLEFDRTGETVSNITLTNSVSSWRVPLPNDRVEALCLLAGTPIREREWASHLADVPPRDVCDQDRS